MRFSKTLDRWLDLLWMATTCVSSLTVKLDQAKHIPW